MNSPLYPTEPSTRRRGQPAAIAAKLLAAIVLTFVFTGTTLAIEQPPDTAPQQRAWLVSHLVTDMQSVGSFSSTDTAQMVTLVNSLTDDQVGLLARFYCLTREKTEQDAQLYATEQTESGDALAQAKAQVADVLAQLQGQIQQTYADLAANPACETLCQVAYASVPGWCAYNQYAIPAAYYSGGCYVGPLYAASYCGPYAAPVYHAFYNRASHYNYWNYKGYIHNNLVRIGHAGHYGPAVIGRPAVRPAVRHGGAVIVNHHAAVVRHAPAVVARHNAVKVRGHVAVAHARVARVAHAAAHRAPHVAHAAAHRAPHVAHAAGHARAGHVAVAHSGGRRR
jgi:hypothetical protein